jgi:hypothetical protein
MLLPLHLVVAVLVLPPPIFVRPLRLDQDVPLLGVMVRLPYDSIHIRTDNIGSDILDILHIQLQTKVFSDHTLT